MDKVKALLGAGASLSGAVRESLAPLTVRGLAERHGFQRTALSAALNGWRPATETMIDALVTELGGTAEEWRDLFRTQRIAAAQAA